VLVDVFADQGVADSQEDGEVEAARKLNLSGGNSPAPIGGHSWGYSTYRLIGGVCFFLLFGEVPQSRLKIKGDAPFPEHERYRGAVSDPDRYKMGCTRFFRRACYD
jgi:hypothetical protein